MGWVDPRVGLDQRCPWVGSTHGLGCLGWAGLGWVETFSFLVGWVTKIRAFCLNYNKQRCYMENGRFAVLSPPKGLRDNVRCSS